MTREIIAATILVIMIALSLVNIAYVGNVVEGLTEDVYKVEALSRAGEPEKARELLQQSADRWMDFSVYAGVMLRHSDEITDVTDSYFSMLETLEAGNRLPEATCAKLTHGLSDIAATESLSLSSLF